MADFDDPASSPSQSAHHPLPVSATLSSLDAMCVDIDDIKSHEQPEDLVDLMDLDAPEPSSNSVTQAEASVTGTYVARNAQIKPLFLSDELQDLDASDQTGTPIDTLDVASSNVHISLWDEDYMDVDEGPVLDSGELCIVDYDQASSLPVGSPASPIGREAVTEVLRTLASNGTSLSTRTSGTLDAAAALEVVARFIRGNGSGPSTSGPSASRKKKRRKKSGRAVHREDLSKQLSVS